MLNYTQNTLLLRENKQLTSKISNSKSAADSFAAYLATPIRKINQRRIMADHAFIMEVNKILTTILEIARKPHFTIKEQDIIVRSSLINEFSNERFNSTIKESSLWRKKAGTFTPEFAYAAEYNDNFRVYENIIVKMCFSQIELIVEHFKDYYQNYISDFKTSFEFDNYSFTSIFNNDKHKLLNKKYLRLHDDVNIILSSLHQLEQKMNYLKKTFFYHQIKDTNPIRDKIIATNILKFNRKYNQVFRFYLELLKSTKNPAIEEAYLNYYLSVLLSVIDKKYKLRKEKQVFTNSRLNLKFSNNRFFLNLLKLRKNTFIFKVKAEDQRSINAFSSLTIIDSLDKYRPIKEVSAYEYVLCKETLYRYTAAAFIPLKYNYSQGDEGLLETLVSSLSVHIDIDDKVNLNSCPICGQSNINRSRLHDVTCLDCGANHAIINFKTKRPFLWIKKVNVEVKES